MPMAPDAGWFAAVCRRTSADWSLRAQSSTHPCTAKVPAASRTTVENDWNDYYYFAGRFGDAVTPYAAELERDSNSDNYYWN